MNGKLLEADFCSSATENTPSAAEMNRHEEILSTMTERHRRTYLRKMEKGLVGLLTEPLKPESDSEDFDDFSDDFDDDGEESD